MNRCHLVNHVFLFLLIVVIVFTCGTCNGNMLLQGNDQTVYYTLYNSIHQKDYVFPYTFLKAYMLKDNPKLLSFNVTRSGVIDLLKDEKMVKSLRIGIVSSWDTTKDYRQIMNDFFRFYQLEHIVEQVSFTIGRYGTCQANIFDNFDIIFSHNQMFYMWIRIFRNGNRSYKMDDFLSVTLAPFYVFVITEPLGPIEEYTVHNLVWNTTCNDDGLDFISQLVNIARYETKVEYFFYTSKSGNGTLFEREDRLFMSSMNGFDIMYVSSQVADNWKNKIVNYYNINENTSYQSYLLPQCTACKNDYCEEFVFADTDYWIIPVTLLMIIHYCVIFFSGSFRTPALKIRLLIPYLLPIIVFYFEIHFSIIIVYSCKNVRNAISGFILTGGILTYAFTIIRVYYLRNLYHIINTRNIESSIRNIAFQRKISGPLPGILLTGGIALMLVPIFGSPYLVAISSIDEMDNSVIVLNALYAVYIGLGCSIGGIAIVLDLVFNRRKLKEKGLKYVLFFDDPFLIRLEVFLLSLCIVFIVLISIPSIDFHSARFFRFMIYVIVILNSGLLVSFKQIITKVFNRKKKNEISNLEVYMQNSAFQIMMKEYCVKEMSLENYNCYMFLERLKEKTDQLIDLTVIQQLEKDYFALNSIYELNIPSNVRKSFYELLKQVEDSHAQLCEMAESNMTGMNTSHENSSIPKYSDLIELVNINIISNLGDTLSRLEVTNEYQVWQELYDIQSKSSVI
ncbi:predicted protein [Naegleria gruberi]|uniref:Predicted protein n=1 Tax=Naegleria gruberi TaxID=5762 RepID=D2VUM0_NAEGR|nr:uncharacterized protein NAEGRDRAFT_72711 [Naegleria gruberi]EFC39475.1 predicted protein [Naegleria gruberi]|eukprot:XP_002672219.1 predicted protein [Naegleria gruberi strain NEG-M]